MTSRILIATLFLSVAACTTEPRPDPAIGEYDLVTVNDAPLPQTVDNTVIHAGGISLGADLNFSDWTETSSATTGGQRGTTGVSGTWARIGSNLIQLTATQPAGLGTRNIVVVDDETLRSTNSVYIYKRVED